MTRETKTEITIIIFTVVNNRLYIYLKPSDLSSSEFISGKSLDILANDRLQAIIKNPTYKPYIEQLYTFMNPDSIAVSYYALIPANQLNDSLLNNFTDIEKIGDSQKNKEIIQYAIQRLRWKIEYTNVVYSLLPEEFTLSNLQRIYESILGKVLDKRNFRKKILTLGLITPTGRKRKGVKARPASIYRFTSTVPTIIHVFS